MYRGHSQVVEERKPKQECRWSEPCGVGLRGTESIVKSWRSESRNKSVGGLNLVELVYEVQRA